MAITEIYVDPSIAADSGAGTIGDPYGDLEYAIEQTTFDTTNGTRVNIKVGTDEVLAASLNNAFANTGTTPAWAPVEVAPCIFEGYSTAAGDLRGTTTRCGISGGGSVGVFLGDAINHTMFINCHLHNTGSAEIISMNDFVTLINCELDNTTGNAIDLDSFGLVHGCYIHNVGGIGAITVTGRIDGNYFENGTNDFTFAIQPAAGTTVSRNIISIDGTSTGISSPEGSEVIHNSIYSNGGTGKGIVTFSSALQTVICNNLVEGFSGSGGIGIDAGPNAFVGVRIFDGNAVYNCATAYNGPTTNHTYGGTDNETLSASPFTNAAGGDFSPVDTGNVKEGALPQSWNNG